MKHTNTGVDDREQWRARITRALDELRAEDSVMDTRSRPHDNDDSALDPAEL